MLCPLVSREQLRNQGRPTGSERFIFKVPAGRERPGCEAKYQCRTKGSRALCIVPNQCARLTSRIMNLNSLGKKASNCCNPHISSSSDGG
jgi:hypothetical protein